jgi:hypothetical protein
MTCKQGPYAGHAVTAVGGDWFWPAQSSLYRSSAILRRHDAQGADLSIVLASTMEILIVPRRGSAVVKTEQKKIACPYRSDYRV